jgi:hypothetical protein
VGNEGKREREGGGREREDGKEGEEPNRARKWMGGGNGEKTKKMNGLSSGQTYVVGL